METRLTLELNQDGAAKLPVKSIDVDAFRNNLIRLFEQSTKQDILDGLSWYDNAADFVKALSAGSDYTIEQCAAVVAACSMGATWAANKTMALKALEAHKANKPIKAGWPHKNQMCQDILDGKPWDVTLKGKTTDTGHGNKIYNFCLNILGDDNAFTADMWMSRAAYIDCINGDKASSPSNKVHDAICEAGKQAADIVGIAPRKFQAAVWVKVRGGAE